MLSSCRCKTVTKLFFLPPLTKGIQAPFSQSVQSVIYCSWPPNPCTAERRHIRRRDDDNNATHSDLMYQSSTATGSTTRIPTTEDSRNSSLSHTMHPPIAGMQPRAALTVNHPVTPALVTVVKGKTGFIFGTCT